MATHDLRQPLQTIIASLELLERRLGTGPERAHIDRGARAGAKLAEQLDLLADALRLHERAGGIRREPVRLQALLDGAALEHADPARRRGLALRIVPARHFVMSDPVLLAAILRNLVRNALKYTAPGGRVVVGCRRRGALLAIEVHDTGIGIPADKLARIFEAFQRLDTWACEGLGLGLFIVKRAADALQHGIEVRSTCGRGSTFIVAVEAASGMTGASPAPVEARPPSSGPARATRAPAGWSRPRPMPTNAGVAIVSGDAA